MEVEAITTPSHIALAPIQMKSTEETSSQPCGTIIPISQQSDGLYREQNQAQLWILISENTPQPMYFQAYIALSIQEIV